MKISEQIEKVFKEQNIRFLKGSGDTENIFNVLYRGIDDKNNHVKIYMEVSEELNIIKFLLIEKANVEIDINELKATLLNTNSMLNFGTLSMRNDSTTVEYKVDYQLGESGFSFDQYRKFIVLCISMYENLKKDALIS